MILSLTVALAAAVVWWVTSGEFPSFSFFPGRRGGTGSAAARRFEPGGEEGPAASTGNPATTGWPRAHPSAHPAPARRRGEEPRLGPVVGHRSSRRTFTYGIPVEDRRPPIILTILRLVFAIALVAGLIAAGSWAVGHFVTSFMTKLIGE